MSSIEKVHFFDNHTNRECMAGQIKSRSTASSMTLLMSNMGKGGVEAVVMSYLRRLAGKDIHTDVLLHENSPFPQRREPKALNIASHSKPSVHQKTLAKPHSGIGKAVLAFPTQALFRNIWHFRR